jgi:hypothetical protein
MADQKMTNFYHLVLAATERKPGCTSGLGTLGATIDEPNDHGMPPIFVAFCAGDVLEAENILQLGARVAGTCRIYEETMTLASLVQTHKDEGRTQIARELGVLLARFSANGSPPRSNTGRIAGISSRAVTPL